MLVKNNQLYSNDGIQVEFRPTENLSAGKKDIRFIVLHYDGATNETSAVNWLTQKGSGVSCDLHISKSGKVTQMAKFNQITWHVGASRWGDLTGLNKYAIGIEQQNRDAQSEWTELQIQRCIEVCKALVAAYPSITEILAHSEVATPAGRKDDPGPKFPMDRVRREVFGIVTKSTTSDLNLRSGPGTKFGVLKVLPRGTSANVLSVSGSWSNVEIGGLKGWVSNQYLK
ncbi:N-acetylmuramoyl-L-alanine amidase [Sphingobacterium sp. InxBP1]|uniref:N-acetylmuramoyl-L-alanine amidase n=1 Tax=Sphingobacterium sp. InxBP1 TaxID=2870328 RepID=UPI002243EA8E|nr:N-acetylmuramoyl-L-alanine amidase [Sphingobacterium sp. InxBP1]MCW8314224.1 N-acetylmuramoyl-L-alanine amidase [Sphingobacterium sp. InxBP1]